MKLRWVRKVVSDGGHNAFISLRTRLSLATLALIACIVALFYAAARYVVVQTVREAENEVTQIRLDVQRSVTRELLALHQLANRLARDVKTQAPPEAAGAAPADAVSLRFADLSREHQLSLILLRQGRDGHVQLFRRGEGQPDRIGGCTPDALRDYLLPGSPLLQPHALTGACAGLIALEGKMVLVAAAAVPGGAEPELLLIGRNLNDQPLQERIGHWRKNFNLQVMIRPKLRIPRRSAFGDMDRLPAVFGPSRNFIPGGAWHVGRDAFETMVPLRDLHGDTVGAVSITLPGTFRSVANELLDKLLWVVCGVGAVITLLAFYGLSRAVIAPLRQMTGEIVALAREHPRKARLGWRRKDEFGELACTLDALLDRMDEDAQQILAREREAQAIFAAVPDVFCVFDRQGGTLRSMNCGNPAARRITDRLQVGATIACAGVSDEVVEAFAAALEQGAKDRASLSLIFPCKAPEPDLHVECRIVRLDDARVLAVFRDMTAEQLARRKFTEMEGKLLQLQRNEALGHLVGGIAHDFNNLLGVIQSSLENHQNSGRARQGAVEDEDLQAIAQSARQAAELIRQLQVYAGISDMVFERVNLNTLLSNTWALLRASVPHHIELETDKAPHLPDIVADSTQMVQVVSNLLLNAAEAIGSNPGIIRLSTRLVRGAELRSEGHALSRELRADWYVALTVNDNGRGIAPAQLNRILEPFFSTKGEGRGLGLATVAGILESHDAVLSVTSLLGKGSSFHVFLPVSVETQSPAPVAEALQAEARARHARDGRLCILLVEDDPRIRSILRLLLESMGCEVLDASQEAEARLLIQRHLERIDLLVLDANIRGMDGVRVLRALRQKSPSLPTYLISGHDEPSVRRVFAGIPFEGFIAKPFTRDAIVAMLEHVRSLAPDAAEERPLA